jgi:hypothetical protein
MRCFFVLAALILWLSSPAHADGIGFDSDSVGFTANPATNSQEFAAFVANLGQSLTTLDFETHPGGVLQPDFYASLGVRLTTTTRVTVRFGPGPGESDTSTPPTSSGEGAHPDSRFLFFEPVPSQFTISFASPVSAVGFSTIDLYNPAGLSARNPVSIEAFAGPNGTGPSLGVFDSAQFNFQRNFLYFMGVGSPTGNIGSLVWTDPVGQSSDYVAIDNIQFSSSPAPTPEPASLLLLSSGASVLIGLRRRAHLISDRGQLNRPNTRPGQGISPTDR